MSDERLPYADPSTTAEMTADCQVVGAALRLPTRSARRRTPAERARRAAVRPAPSLHYEDCPREAIKPSVDVSEAASRLAAAIHPYLD